MNSRKSIVLEQRLAWPLLCALVFTIPWEKSLIVPGVGTITRLLGWTAAAAVILVVLLRRRLRTPNPALVALALFSVWSALTFFWSIDPPASAARALTFLQLLVMVWLVWELAVTPNRQRTLIAAFVAGAIVSSSLTLLRFVRDLETYYRRYAAAGFEPNDLGLTVALAIPLALHLASERRRYLPWLWRAAAALAIAAVLLSASRTALIVSLLAFLLPVWTWRAADHLHRASVVMLFSLLVLGALFLAPSSSRQRLATLPQEITQGTLHNRTQIWKAGLKVFRRRPVIGMGVGAYPAAVRPWLGVPGRPGHQYVAHNTYLSVLVESGLVGFTLFSITALLLAVFVWVMPSMPRALWAVMLLACGTGIVALTWEHRKPLWLIAALIMTEWARSFSRPDGET